MAAVALPPTLDPTHLLHRRGGALLLIRRGWEAALPVQAMLEGAPVQGWGEPVPHALRGRGEVHVLSTPAGQIVAKRLQRGGVLGGFLRTWFADARRPLREAEAAERLARRGCPTPPVVAARVLRGPFGLCRIETATRREMGAVDLVDALRSARDLPVLARAAGRSLRAAHDAGLHHRDLQAKNLLVPADFPGPGGREAPRSLVILDLDRCRVDRPLNSAERTAALARLGRSLVKQGLLPREAGGGIPGGLWACRDFFRAYGPLDHSSEGRALGAVAGSLRRVVARHLLLWSEDAESGRKGSSIAPTGTSTD